MVWVDGDLAFEFDQRSTPLDHHPWSKDQPSDLALIGWALRRDGRHLWRPSQEASQESSQIRLRRLKTKKVSIGSWEGRAADCGRLSVSETIFRSKTRLRRFFVGAPGRCQEAWDGLRRSGNRLEVLRRRTKVCARQCASGGVLGMQRSGSLVETCWRPLALETFACARARWLVC